MKNEQLIASVNSLYLLYMVGYRTISVNGRTDGRTGVYSAGIAPMRHRRRRPRVGGAVRRTRFGPDLPIRRKTGRPRKKSLWCRRRDYTRAKSAILDRLIKLTYWLMHTWCMMARRNWFTATLKCAVRLEISTRLSLSA